jgi:hypothetical protein
LLHTHCTAQRPSSGHVVRIDSGAILKPRLNSAVGFTVAMKVFHITYVGGPYDGTISTVLRRNGYPAAESRGHLHATLLLVMSHGKIPSLVGRRFNATTLQEMLDGMSMHIYEVKKASEDGKVVSVESHYLGTCC